MHISQSITGLAINIKNGKFQKTREPKTVQVWGKICLTLKKKSFQLLQFLNYFYKDLVLTSNLHQNPTKLYPQ